MRRCCGAFGLGAKAESLAGHFGFVFDLAAAIARLRERASNGALQKRGDDYSPTHFVTTGISGSEVSVLTHRIPASSHSRASRALHSVTARA